LGIFFLSPDTFTGEKEKKILALPQKRYILLNVLNFASPLPGHMRLNARIKRAQKIVVGINRTIQMIQTIKPTTLFMNQQFS